MADMTFMLKFIADNAKALEAIKQMQDAAKAGESGKQAADAAKAEKSAKGAADAAKAQTKAAKETQAATKGVATEAAKAEAAVRKTAEAGKAVTAETQAASRAAEEASRQEATRAEARVREIARRRKAYSDFEKARDQQRIRAQEPHWQDYWRARHEAEATARAMKQAEAASKGTAAAQRDVATATAKTAQEAAKAESRMGKIGQALRNVSWARVAGGAAADLAKGIAKGVADAVKDGLKSAAASAPAIFRGQGLMGGGPGVRGAVQGSIVSGIAANQGRETAVNGIQFNLGEGEAQARAAIAAADAAAASTGNTVPPAEMRQAAVELARGQVGANEQLLRQIADASAASGGQMSVASIAEAYARAARENDIGQLVSQLQKGTVTTDDQGQRVLNYRHGGQDVTRAIPAGDIAATKAAMNELLATYDGAMAKFQATPAGIIAQAKAQAELALSKVMEQPFQYITGRMQTINAELAAAGAGGMDAMAQRLGTQIVDGMKEAERVVISITTNVREMVKPVDDIAQSMGGWKVAVGGLVALNIAGWLGGAAAGLRSVAAASVVLAASPAGRVLAGAAVAGYFLNEAWSGKPPTEGSHQANAQAEVRAVKSALADLWAWANRPINQPGPTPEPTPGPVAMPAGTRPPAAAAPAAPTAPAASAAAASEQAALALATIDAVTPAAQAMVAAVTGILAGANFHSHGVAMMETLAAGIRAGSAAAVAAVRETTQAMRDHLPHSPAKTGPLSDLDKIRFSETLAGAITPGPAVAAVLAVAAGMRGALPAGLGVGLGAGLGLGAMGAATAAAPPAIPARAAAGGMSLVYSPTITLPAGARPDDFRQLLEQHKHEIAEMVSGLQRRRADLSFE